MKSKKDQTSYINLDMPEVKDIPGQEHIRPPRLNGLADTTASSDGEEGKGILDDLNKGGKQDPEDDVANLDEETNVSDEEIELLKKSERPQSPDSESVEKLALDDTDGEDPLNEEGNASDLGVNLDIPGAELDDENEDIGEEDEENNPYTNSNIEEE